MNLKVKSGKIASYLLKLFFIVGALFTMFIFGGCADDAGSAPSKSSAGSEAASDVHTYNVATRGTAKPFSYVDDKGELTGYDIAILKEVEKRNPGIKFNFQTMSISSAFVAMDSNQIDLIANQITKNPDRESKYIFTNEVNNYTSRKIVVKEGRTDIQTVDDLKGKKVALTGTGEAARDLKKYNETANPQIELIFTDKGAAETLNMVATGRADAALEYTYAVDDVKKSLGLKVETVGNVIKSDPTYFVFRKSDETQKLADIINKTVKEMKEDGTLKQLSEQFLGADYTVPQK